MQERDRMAASTTKQKKKPNSAEKEDEVFKALANRDRRSIIDFLSAQSRTTGEICSELPKLDRCTVMMHLRVLENAGLLITKKQGRCKLHYLNVVPIQTIYDRWIKPYAQPAAKLLARLSAELE